MEARANHAHEITARANDSVQSLVCNAGPRAHALITAGAHVVSKGDERGKLLQRPLWNMRGTRRGTSDKKKKNRPIRTGRICCA